MLTAIENQELKTEKLSLAIPNCDHGIGKMIIKADSPDLISGVVIEQHPVWPDDRGYFIEVARMNQGSVQPFEKEQTQVSAALSYPGTIKAFHYHEYQHDFWVPVSGMFQVVLVDFRRDSSTFGLRNTFYVGHLRPWQLLVPPGVGHGYKVLGTEPGTLVYVTSRIYNPKDEGRVPYNHPGINYDWELQYK